MKNYLILTLLLTSTFGFSQKKTEDFINLKRNSIINLKLTDLLTDLPKDCKSYSYEVVSKVFGKPVTANATGNKLSAAAELIFKNSDADSFVYLEAKADCGKIITKTSKFKILD